MTPRDWGTLLGAVVALGTSVVVAERKEFVEAAARLENARQLVELRRAENAPFELVARCTAPGLTGAVGQECSYRLVWASPDDWREETVIGAYVLHRGARNGTGWRLPARGARPLGADLVAELLDVSGALRLREGQEVGKVELSRVGADRIVEIEIRRDGYEGSIYLDDTSGLPAGVLGGGLQHAYSAWKPFAASEYPRRFRLRLGAETLIEATVVTLERLEVAEPSIFEPPTGAEPWTPCDELAEPELVSRVNPDYPEGVRLQRKQGVVTLGCLIDTLGVPHRVTVVRSSGNRQLDAAAAAALVMWRFKPAQCQGEPVDIGYSLTVTFALR